MNETRTPTPTRATMHPAVRQMRLRRINAHIIWMASGRAEAKSQETTR